MTPNINKGLEHLPQTTPPDMVWENIERKLDENKPDRATFWLKFTAGAAAAVVLFAFSFFLFSNIDDENSTKTAQQKSNQHPPAFSHSTPPTTVGSKEQTPNTPTTEISNSINDTVIINDSTVAFNILDATNMQTLAFSNSSAFATSQPTLNGAVSYNWNFGDGKTNTFRGNINSYATQGSYSHKFKESNNIGFLDAEGKSISKRGYFLGGALNLLELHGDSIDAQFETPSNESYAPLIENEYQNPLQEPLSTFSIDVDNASYSNIRRMINNGFKPPKDAVRIEEFVNYFQYNYAPPKSDDPFEIYLETATCPWNKDTKVVSIGIQGKKLLHNSQPASNLVFLIDVSGSMSDENKLPLVKQSLKLLAEQLNENDYISIVTYAGSAGLALPPTPANELSDIKTAIDNLESGGSTAGGEGIALAYKVAKQNLKPNGNNRIILVTDGDFNVGLQSDSEMEKMIEEKRKEGIFLTVCGFGMDNYKDSKMEILADKGNGNYYYIDTYNEGKKVFVTDLQGTLYTIAKDVKIQVEFNPKFVKAYRLIGYENRRMPAQDFDDDTKDAGELGAGHTVTALYEIIPAGSTAKIVGFTELKYQASPSPPSDNLFANELLTVKLRYKQPKGETSQLIQKVLNNNGQSYNNASDNLRFACGVATFGMLLRDSKFKGNATYTLAKQLLLSTKLNIENGYRAELIELITKTEKLLY